MKTSLIAIASLVASVASANEVGVQTSELTRLDIDRRLDYAETIDRATVTIDNERNEATLALFRHRLCPPDRVCIALMPAPVIVRLPIKSVFGDRCGNRHVRAERDQRPVDGNFESLEIVDGSASRCARPMHEMHLPVRVTHELVTAGFGGPVRSFRSTFEGREFNGLPSHAETFRMYREPGHRPDPGCDVGTRLTLDRVRGTATLVNYVGGFCEIHVNPDPRTYKLLPGRGNADGARYFGERRTRAGVERVEIADYRNSVLTIVREAEVIVRETRAEGRVSVLYSEAR
jgi:hypothetical protein